MQQGAHDLLWPLRGGRNARDGDGARVGCQDALRLDHLSRSGSCSGGPCRRSGLSGMPRSPTARLHSPG